MSAYRKLLDRYVERYNAGDLDAVVDLYADDAVQGMPDGIFEGRDAIHDRLARELEAIPDVTHTVVSFIEQGDMFADEWTFVGTQTGPFLLPNGTMLPPSGKRVEVRGMEVVRRPGWGDRPQHALLRQPGRRRPARPCPRGRDRLIGQ